MIVGDGTTDPVAESGATLRTSIGVGTGDTPQFTGIEVGAATDTTLVRSGAGDLTVEGNAIYRAGGTDVAVADGGTGLGSGTSGGILAYTAAGTLASSALLTQYGPVIGGGAGAAPSAIAAGSNNQVLRGATGAAPAFGALVDADVPDDITINDPDGTLTTSNGVFNGGVTIGTFLDVPVLGLTTTYTVDANDVAITLDSSGGNYNVTLPEASTCIGKVKMFSCVVAGNTVSIITDGTDKFDGTNNKATVDAVGDCVTLIPTAADVWAIFGQNGMGWTTQ
jgi:hypothetical protein